MIHDGGASRFDSLSVPSAVGCPYEDIPGPRRSPEKQDPTVPVHAVAALVEEAQIQHEQGVDKTTARFVRGNHILPERREDSALVDNWKDNGQLGRQIRMVRV